MIPPPLAEFLRWVGDMPAAFRAEPGGFPGGRTSVRAVVADLLETSTGEAPDDGLLRAFDPAGSAKTERNRMLWVLAGCHLMWHPSIRGSAPPLGSLRRFLIQELSPLASVVPAEKLLSDEERREELVRRALRALEWTLPGETAREAAHRLEQVDSVERHRVLAEAAAKEKRAREVREAMQKKAAAEAAAKASRE